VSSILMIRQKKSFMSKFDEKLATYEAALKSLDKGADMDLLRAVTKGLGPSIYNNDSNKVACSDPTELERVVKNFCVKKLGVSASKGEAAVQAACAKYTERAKHRAVFYYLVVKDLGKESVYG
jgi:hypothetical protein